MKTNLTISIPVWLDRLFTWPVTWYRKRRFGYSFRRIDLGEGEWTILDEVDYYRFAGFNWCADGSNGNIYAVRGAKIAPGEFKIVRLHREIMNAPPGLLVDHRNCNTLDNRRQNLRLATRLQNAFNRSKRKSKASSKFIGVSRDTHRGKWIARTYYNYKQIWLGRFDSEIEAARAYDEAAKKYHKDFARLNFPEA